MSVVEKIGRQEPAKRETVVDRLRRILSDEIVTGVLGPGVRLDEQSLADRFEVSRTPIRETLSQLSALGLVEKRPHKGVVVLVQTRERLLQELTLVRHRGYAVDDEECETGVMCIAVPIYDCTDRIVAAMSLTGPAERMNAWTDGDRKYLMERAAALSRELGATM